MWIREIAHDRMDVRVVRCKLPETLQPSRTDDHVGAGSSKHLCESSPQTTAGAGDQRNATVEAELRHGIELPVDCRHHCDA